MFKIVSKHLFWWPVTVRMPDPERPGAIREQSFDMRFEAIPDDQARAIDEARHALPPDEQTAHLVGSVVELCRDWRDVQDDEGGEVPFSAEELRSQLSFPWFRAGVVSAYQQALSGQAARRGN